MQNPVIVQGMHKSGTTLLAQMIHEGGVLMIEDGVDPCYDNGGAYERVLCKKLNRHILGKRPDDLEDLRCLRLNPLSKDELQELQNAVGDRPWGFKDPRTIWSYEEWTRHFPQGARLYIYRDHLEVMLHFCRRKPWHLLRVRRALSAWLLYNERMVENYRSDLQNGRPCVLMRYGDLMESATLIAQIEERTGLHLHDSRQFAQYRNRCTKGRWPLYRAVAFFYKTRLQHLYRVLDELRLQPHLSAPIPVEAKLERLPVS